MSCMSLSSMKLMLFVRYLVLVIYCSFIIIIIIFRFTKNLTSQVKKSLDLIVVKTYFG